MRLDVRADVLADALSMAALALDPKNKTEPTRAVHITTGADEIRLTVNTVGRVIATACTAVVTESGEAAVRAVGIAALAGNFSGGADITIEAVGATVVVTCDRSRYRLAAIPIADLPAKPAIDTELGRVELDRDHAVRLFAAPSFACDVEQTRPYLSGIYLANADDYTLIGVGTDGHRLAKQTVAATGALSSDRRLIVPLASVKVINKLLARTKDGTILLRRSRSLLELTGPNFTLVTKLIDAEYPAYERVIPCPSGNAAVVDRRLLALALERFKAAVDPQCGLPPAVTLQWQHGGELHLDLHRQPNAAADAIAAEVSGEASVVAGLDYLAEIAGEFAGATVKLDSTDGTTPILITDPADSDLLVLQVPIG